MSPTEGEMLIKRGEDEYYFEDTTHSVILNGMNILFPAEGGLPKSLPENYNYLPLETKVEVLKYLLDCGTSDINYFYVKSYLPLDKFNPLLVSFLFTWNQYLENSGSKLLLWCQDSSYYLTIEPLGKSIVISDFEIRSILTEFIHTGFYDPEDKMVL